MIKLNKTLIAFIGTVCVAGSVAAVVVAYNATHNDFKNAPTQIGACKDPAVTAVIYSIQSHPESWDTDSYRMWHNNDVSIWTANEDYGLSLTMGTKNASPDRYKIDDDCRAILYTTTQTWLGNALNAKLRT